MINFARMISRNVPNAHFETMNLHKPFTFPDASFDLVHGRFLFGFLKTTDWLPLLRECHRVLKPGGIMICYEAELNITNSTAFERLSSFFALASYRAKQRFSPDGRHLGIP